MRLRPYETADAAVICTWIKTEEELYMWSADRFNKFPLTALDIVENYAPQIDGGRFFAFVAVDDDESVVGHFIIRYPKEDDSLVRFGFVVVDPSLRGRGYGQAMLRLGMDYAYDVLRADKIDLGVFAGNDKARRCYEALGFREYARRECVMPIGTWECIDMVVERR